MEGGGVGWELRLRFEAGYEGMAWGHESKTISLRDAKDDGALGRRERMLSYLKKFASSSSLLRDIRS